MHLVIANKIAEHLALTDKTTFLFGGIAPDAVSSKDISHFFTGEVQNYSRSIDYKAFLKKYSAHVENQYILGYFTHLIADDIWLKGFYLPWLKNRMEVDSEVADKYHNDFRLLNAKILDYYGLKDEFRKYFYNIPTLIDLDEVKPKDIESFIPDLLVDMDYNKEVINEELSIFIFHQIIGYIETSVEKGIFNIKQISNVWGIGS